MRSHAASRLMNQAPYELDTVRRDIVRKAIESVCGYRRWQLSAVHVRTNHVHVVVSAEERPEKVMTDFKCYASRALGDSQKHWSRHGSTRYLWNRESINAAIRYVAEGQGEPMALFVQSRDGHGAV